MYEDLIQIMRREAMNVFQRFSQPSTMAATAYNPDTHAVKGILVPDMVETGWIPLTSLHAGDGFGILIGPNVGSAENLDGDMFDIHFANGDPNTPIAKHKHFSQADRPPRVESGEILFKHQGGGSIMFAKDKSTTITHADGGTIKFDADGNVTIKTNDKAVTVDAGSGAVTYKAASHSFDGDMNLTGNLNTSGTVAATGVTSGGRAVRTV